MAKDKYKKEKFYITYMCGHEEKIYIGGYSEEYRNRQAEQIEMEECPECKKKKREEEARQNAIEMELPELTGTPKQIKYAMVLRDSIIQNFDSLIKRLEPKEFDGNIQIAFDNFINDTKEAKVLIDGYGLFDENRADNLMNFLKDYLPEKMQEKEMEREAKEEVVQLKTIVPEDFNNNTVEIKVEKNTIKVISAKDYDVIDLVRSLRYTWNRPAWEREITKFSGTLEDRVVEVAYKLMKNGYAVTIDVENFEELKKKIVNGDYKKEVNRWVAYNTKTGKISISWRGYNDDLYSGSKRIKGATWSSGQMLVPVSSYLQILDFADIYGFSISDVAMEHINKYREEFELIEKSEVAERIEKREVSKLVDMLEDTSSEVIGDLIDN